MSRKTYREAKHRAIFPASQFGLLHPFHLGEAPTGWLRCSGAERSVLTLLLLLFPLPWSPFSWDVARMLGLLLPTSQKSDGRLRHLPPAFW